MCGSDGALVVGTVDGWQGRAEGVAQGCRCCPQPHCPCRLTLRHGHDGQTFERGSNIHDGQTSKQALFIHRTCCCMVTSNGEDLSEKRARRGRSEEHTSELQSPCNLVCRLLLDKKNHSLTCHVLLRETAPSTD